MRLIDILNKIANGELKEGTKLVLGNNGGIEYKGKDDYFMFQGKDLTKEVELIEPDHFTDVGEMAEPTECNHIWREGTNNFGIVPVRFRKCKKCGCTQTTTDYLREDTKMIEPTDNTKIEELNILEIEDNQNIDNLGLAKSIGDLNNTIREIQHKLNEVIRYINKENNNE